MTFGWAVRGSAGFGSVPGCVFAGTMLGICWYVLAREPGRLKRRKFSLGWCVLAITIGIGIQGMHGWMQWPHWIKGRIYSNFPTDWEMVNPAWGYAWWFVAAMPWAGMGAVFLGWTGSDKPARWWEWITRAGSGVCGALLALVLFHALPRLFLPLYDQGFYSLDVGIHDTIQRAVNDNKEAIMWMGAYLGFIAHEMLRKEWRTVKMALLVGAITGIWWMFFQWLIEVNVGQDPPFDFNWWRVWEALSGTGIGISYGIAFFLFNKRRAPKQVLERDVQPFSKTPNLAKLFGVELSLIATVGYNLRNGIASGLKETFLEPPVNEWLDGGGSIPTDLLEFLLNAPKLLVLIVILAYSIPIGLFVVHHHVKHRESYRKGMVDGHGPIDYFTVGILGIQLMLGFFATGRWADPVSSWFLLFYVLLMAGAMTLVLVVAITRTLNEIHQPVRDGTLDGFTLSNLEALKQSCHGCGTKLDNHPRNNRESRCDTCTGKLFSKRGMQKYLAWTLVLIFTMILGVVLHFQAQATSLPHEDTKRVELMVGSLVATAIAAGFLVIYLANFIVLHMKYRGIKRSS
ncbi:hypothetical protein GF325_14975 [Candidatus Bathyarchaeota archaeon]|nr:hypothetical protein [Candidatus Bathyarchaeota archaeon]